MEKKFLSIVAVSTRGNHFFKVLDRGTTLDSQGYIDFLSEMSLSCLKTSDLFMIMLVCKSHMLLDNLRKVLLQGCCHNLHIHQIVICVTGISFRALKQFGDVTISLQMTSFLNF